MTSMTWWSIRARTPVAHTLAQATDDTWDYWFAYVGGLEAELQPVQSCDRDDPDTR